MSSLRFTAALATIALAAPATASGAPADVDFEPLGRASLTGAEIAAFEPKSERAFVTDAGANALHVVDLSDPSDPDVIRTVDLAPYGAGPNSVAVSPAFGGLVAVAVESDPKTDPGSVVLFDTDGEQRGRVLPAGALPDMLTFTPDGRTLLVANEGEPNDLYDVDPEGSVTVIDFERGVGNPDVRQATFHNVPLERQVRIFGLNASVQQDLEPEYIATDGETAWVTLQENNAIGLLDLDTATFSKVKGLGFKDHGADDHGMDASDRDNGIGSAVPTLAQLQDRIVARPGVNGMYQPDAIAAFRAGGETYLVSANEGDARVYPMVDLPELDLEEGDIFNEEVRVNGLTGLGYTLAAPILAQNTASQLGRLTITTPATIGVPALTPAPGSAISSVYAFGARSLSVWNADATLAADTGDDLERRTFDLDKANFNKSNANENLDDRSDNKGPEPEGVAVGQVGEHTYAFLGAERSGGIFAYELSDPSAPAFSGYANTRPADLGPEGVAFVSAGNSPTGEPLVLVTNEISGTLNVLQVSAE